MEYKEYGSKNNDIVILLHGGGLSWWNYIDEISLLENEFHIVIPILDGHSGSDTNFTSIESNALEIINFINKNYNGKVKLIGGLSLGGQILLEILSKNPNICECAIIESALVMPMDFTYKMIEPIFNLSYCLISKKWFSKLQFKSLKLKKSLFALYYEDTCKITKYATIKIHITKERGGSTVSSSPSPTTKPTERPQNTATEKPSEEPMPTETPSQEE